MRVSWLGLREHESMIAEFGCARIPPSVGDDIGSSQLGSAELRSPPTPTTRTRQSRGSHGVEGVAKVNAIRIGTGAVGAGKKVGMTSKDEISDQMIVTCQ
jgi:hypothetical protein